MSRDAWAQQSIQRFLWLLCIVCALFVATEAMALTGWIPELQPLSFREISSNILFAIGFGCPLVLYLSSMPGWRELGIAVMVGVAAAACLSLLQEFGPAQFVTGLGLASLGMLGWRAWRSTGTERLHALVFLLPACVALVTTLEAGIFFKLISSVMPHTRDAAACALDGAHGLQFSFLAGQVFEALPLVQSVCFSIYVAPRPALVFVYALQVRSCRPPPIDVVTVLLIAVGAGYVMYFLYPVAGPRATFPGAFPHSPEWLEGLSIEPIFVPFKHPNGEPAPRNAMPSLHFGSVLLAYWHARPYGWMARITAGIFLAGTFLATLGLGEHYFIDLVVALPFLLLIQAACTPGLADLRREKRTALLAAGALLAGWYGILFEGVELLQSSPVLTWCLTLGTAVSVWTLERRLYRAALIGSETAAGKTAPGPRGSRLFGNLAEFRRDVLHLLLQSHREFGDVVRLRLGPHVVHLLAHPEHIKHVLVTKQRNYNKDTRSSAKIRDLTGRGLLTTSGAYWLRQRRLMQPAFHMQRLAGFTSLMTEAAAAMLRRWREQPADRPLDVASEMMRLTYTIVARALFGADVAGDLDTIEHAAALVMEHAYRRLERLVDLPVWAPTPGNLRFRRALRAIDDVVYRIIARQRDSQHGNLLSLLLQGRDEDTGEGMSAQQVRNETITLLLAGHETTANALTWTWYLLSRHPQVAERMRAEAEEVLQGRTPVFADLEQLKYTTMVFQESMRLYPPIWVMERRALADDRIGGFAIPGGSTVVISPYVTHRHPEFWDRPDAFDPERFAEEQVAERTPFAYVPFGGGQRMCIGRDLAMMEAQVILPMVVQACRLELVPGTLVEPKPGITLRTRHGLPMLARMKDRDLLS